MGQVPTPGSLDEEDRAVELLCRFLTDAGQPSAHLRSPDRDPQDPLTVDAVINVAGREWAVDVCAVTFSPRLRPAMARGESVLRAPLEAIAAEAGIGLHVAYLPQEGEAGTAWGGAYYGRIIETARSLVADGEGALEVVADGTHIEVLAEPNGGEPRVRLSAWLSKTPDIRESVALELTDPVTKKLKGQLARAKSAGYPVALLLDLVAPQDVGVWRQFMAGPDAVRQAVLPLLDLFPGVVDQVWLRDTNNQLHQLV